MKIRSNIITQADVQAAFARARTENGADIHVDEIRTFRPRGHRNGVEVWAASLRGKMASAHGPIVRGGGQAAYQPRAASWSDYGYVMAHLFNVDPHAQVGFYDNEADFVAKVRTWPRKGASLDFLNVLTNIGEYTDGCCADCTS